jgi:hypothetical protein
MEALRMNASVLIDASNPEDRIIRVQQRGASGEIHIRNSTLVPGSGRLHLFITGDHEDQLNDDRDERCANLYDDLRAEFQATQREIERLNRDIASPVGPQNRRSLKRDRADAINRYRDLQVRIKAARPVYNSLAKSLLLHFVDIMREEAFAATPQVFRSYMEKAARRREAEVLRMQSEEAKPRR